MVNNAGISNPDWFEDLSSDQIPADDRRSLPGNGQRHQGGVAPSAAQRLREDREHVFRGGVRHGSEEHELRGRQRRRFRLHAELGARRQKTRDLVNAVAPRASTRLSDTKVLAHVYEAAEETFGEVMEGFAPEFVAPAAAYLAHESCQLNGEVLVAGGGQVLRMAILQTQGFTSPTLTLEELAANLDIVMDMTDATLMEAEVRME